MGSGRRVYVDTSAYLAVLLVEERSRAAAKELGAAGQFLSSALLILEVRRALVHRSRIGKLPPERYQSATERFLEDLRVFRLRPLSLELCLEARLPNVSTPRSLDLAHLSTALWIHAEQPLDRFLSLDQDQLQAARELGLPV